MVGKVGGCTLYIPIGMIFRKLQNTKQMSCKISCILKCQHFCPRKHSLGHTVVVHVCVYTGRSTNAVVKPGTGILLTGLLIN